MKPTLLLPRYFKVIGLLLAISGFIMGLIFQYKKHHFPYYNDSPIKTVNLFPSDGINSFNDEIIITLLVIGFVLIGFSTEKNENEATFQLRLRALHWSFLVYSGLMSVILVVCYAGVLLKIPLSLNHDPVYDITTYNLFAPLVVFVIRFYYLLFTYKNETLPQASRLLPFKPFKLIGKVATCLFIMLFPLAFANKWVENFIFSGVLCAAPTAIYFWTASMEKNDSQTKEAIRLKALQIAYYVNYTLLVILTWCVYSLGFLAVLYFALVSVPLIFLAVFYWMLAREKRKSRLVNLTIDPSV